MYNTKFMAVFAAFANFANALKLSNLKQAFSQKVDNMRAVGEAAVGNSAMLSNALTMALGSSKGQVSMAQLKGYTIAFVIIGTVLTVGLKILVGIGNEINDSTAAEGATQAQEGLLTFTGWLPLIALVIVAVIIIGLIMKFGGASRRKTRGNA